MATVIDLLTCAYKLLSNSLLMRFEGDFTLISIMAEKMVEAIEGFYPYFWHKLRPGNYTEESRCQKWVKDLREAVWVHGIVSLWNWRSFLDKILVKQKLSLKMYASYVFFIISSTVEDLPTIHESFMTSCSLVTAIAAYVYDKGHYAFLEYCPDILMVIFEEKYLNKHDEIEIWEYLDEHLIQCKYSEAYQVVEETIKGNPFADEVYKLEIVAEIKKRIGSKVSIEKYSAIYFQTKKVDTRFRTRKSKNLSFIEDWRRRKQEKSRISYGEERTSEELETGVLISNSDSISQMKQLLAEMEETKRLGRENGLSVIEKNSDGDPRQISLPSDQKLQSDVDKLRQPNREEGTSLITNTRVMVSKGNLPFQTEQFEEYMVKAETPGGGRRPCMIEGNDINSEQIWSLQSKRRFPNDENTSIPSNSEESPVGKSIPVIISSRNWPVQMVPFSPNMENLKIPENEQSLSIAKEDINSTQILSLQSEQRLQNDESTSILSSSKESSAGKRIPEIVWSRNSPFEMEPSSQDVGTPRIPENEQSVSVVMEDDINSKEIPSLQSEQRLQNEYTSVPSNSEESSVRKKTPIKILKQDSSLQMDSSCQNVEMPKIPERGQGPSVTEECQYVMEGISTFISKQRILSDERKLGLSDNEQNIPIESSSKNLNAGDESSRLDTEIATEDYSDMPRVPEAIDQNIKPLLCDKQKLEISDNKQSTPVKSSVENLNSGDKSSRLDTEIATEDYSDTPRVPEALAQNIKPLLFDMEKLEISDNKQSTPVKSSVENFKSGDENSRLDLEATNQNAEQQSLTKSQRKKLKKKHNKEKTETFGENRGSTKMDTGLNNLSRQENQPLQQIEEPMDTEESLPVPTKEDVIQTYLFLERKLKDSFKTVCNLLRIEILESKMLLCA